MGAQRAARLRRLWLPDGARRALRAGPRVPEVRARVRARAAGALLLPVAAGRVPACRGFGRTIGIDWDKVIPDDVAEHRARGRIRPWSGKSAEWERGLLDASRKTQRHPARRAVGTRSRRSSSELVLEGEGDLRRRQVPGRARVVQVARDAHVQDARARAALALPRVHALRRAARARGSTPQALAYRVGGLDLAAWHGLELSRGARAPRVARAPRTGQGELARTRAGQPARATWSASGSATSRSIGRRARSRAARRSACRSPRRSAPRSPARSSCSTSPPWACTRPTSRRSPRRWRELAAARQHRARHRARPARRSAPRPRRSSSGPGAGTQGGQLLLRRHARGARAADGSAHGPRAAGMPRDAARAVARAHGRARRSRGARANNLARRRRARPARRPRARSRGPSGSGKSTLVEDMLTGAWRARWARRTSSRRARVGRDRGRRRGQGASLVDQSPLGRTSRGNPATYTKAWDRVRARFAAEPEARGARASRRRTSRSTSTAGAARPARARAPRRSRCSSSPTWRSSARLPGPALQATRCSPSSIEGYSVADVLAMTVDEALAHLRGRCRASPRALGPLARARASGYLPLGQPLSTLSGGEAQRLKLARALASDAGGRAVRARRAERRACTREDVAHVLEALHGARGGGARASSWSSTISTSCAAADWVIDLGPGGGRDGGRRRRRGHARGGGARTRDAHRRRRCAASGDRRAASRR